MQPDSNLADRVCKLIELRNFSLYIQPGSASGFVRGGKVASVNRVIWPVDVMVTLTTAKSPTNTSIPQVEVIISSDSTVNLQVRGAAG